jgi:hypothetical protein
MTGLLLGGMRPSAAGFPWSDDSPDQLRRLTSRSNFIGESAGPLWIEMRDWDDELHPLAESGVAEYLEHLRALPIEEMVERYERRARIFRTLNSWTRMIPSPIHRRLHAAGRRLLGRWV